MSMTVVVTRNAPPKMRGFLASVMLELAPGVYSAPRISPNVRDRIWTVVEDWLSPLTDASAIMIWASSEQPGGQAVRTLGTTPITMVDLDGLIISRSPIPPGKMPSEKMEK